MLQEAHISMLQGNLDASGDASLQNAMDMAAESLKSIPPYGHREASPCPRSSLIATKASFCSVSSIGTPAKSRELVLCNELWSVVQVLILFAALSTCDPGNVLDAVKAAKQNKIRVSIVVWC